MDTNGKVIENIETYTLYIVPRIENEIFQCIEQDKNKVFCQCLRVDSPNKRDVEYFYSVINTTKAEYDKGLLDSWIVAIEYKGELYKFNDNLILFK